MSVAESRTVVSSSASNKIPPKSWIVERADTPRDTSASFLLNKSVLQTALIALPPSFTTII
jgi:hypothetical protein